MSFKSHNDNNKTSVHFYDGNKGDTLNANPFTQITIQLGPNQPSNYPKLSIFCKVNPLQSGVRKYFLCKKKVVDDSHEICGSDKDKNSVSFTVSSPSDLESISTWDIDYEAKGLSRQDLSGFYFCRLTNEYGILESNFFQVIDENYQRSQISLQINSIYVNNPFEALERICLDSPPIVLHCLNKGDSFPSYTGKSPFEWFIARAKTGVLKSISLKDYLGDKLLEAVNNELISDYFESYVYPNGTLVIYKLKLSMKVNDATIYCTDLFARGRQKIYKIFGSKKAIVSNEEEVFYLPFENCNKKNEEQIGAISSIEQQEISFKANQKLKERKLVAFYRGTSSKFDWKKDNQPVRSGMTQDRFSLAFPEDIYVNDSGIYSLELDNDLKFTFNVTITDIPKFRNTENISNTIYTMHGGSATILYEAVNDDGEFHKELFIDGEKMDLTNEETLKQSKKKLGPLVRPVDISFTPLGNDALNNHKTLNYTVSNIDYQLSESEGPSHAVTVNVYNKQGASRVTTIVQILPIPVIHDNENPKSSGCELNKCYPEYGHLFKCKIDNIPKFESKGIQWRRLWYLNDELIENHPLFTLETLNLALQLNKQENITVLESLRNAQLTCRLIILKPRSTDESYDPTSSIFDPTMVLFDSNATTLEIREKMTTKIIFYKEPDMAALNYLWLIIPIVILIILIVALIFYIKTRPEKEVYHVGEEEEKKGHDVLNEIKEKELFHTYERGDDDPTSEDPSRDESRAQFLPKLNTLNRTTPNYDNESLPPSSSSVSMSDEGRVKYNPHSNV